MEAKALREERAKLVPKIRELADRANDPKHTWTDEDEANWKQLNADFDSLTERLQKLERTEKLEAEMADSRNAALDAIRSADPRRADEVRRDLEIGRPAELESRAFRAWCCRQYDHDVDQRDMAAAQALGINITRPFFDVKLRNQAEYNALRRELRAMNISATTGGDFIPAGFVPQVEKALLDFSGVRQVASVIRTEQGNSLPWPTLNDTSQTGALLAINTQAGAQDIATNAVTFTAFKYTSKIVLVAQELIEDSAIDIGSVVSQALGERLGRILNSEFTTGDDSGNPQGIVVGSSLGKTTAGASAILADEIIDLVHSVDPAYREQPGAGFMMHDLITAYVRKLKDTTNQYLWQPGMQAGKPDTLFGYPVTRNQAMQSTVATATKTMLFGNLAAYYIRDVRSVRVYRLQERYRDFDQDGFVAFSRHDGRILTAGVAPIKHMLQA